MIPSLRLLSLCALSLLVAGCEGERKADEAGTAQGEILPGSVSDAMLPLDTVRSQPPLAPPTSSAGKPQAAASGKGEASESAEADEEEAPAPAPSIAAEAVE